MLLALYWPTVLAAALLTLHRAVRAPRAAMLGLVGFAAFALSAVRWDQIPLPGLGVLFLVGTLSIAALWQLVRFTTGTATAPAVGPLVYLWVLFALFVLVFARSLPLADPTIGLTKGGAFAVRGIAFALVLAGFARFTADDARALATAALTGAVLSAIGILGSGKILTERASLSESTNPITVGRMIGFGVIIAFSRALATAPGRPWKKIGAGLLGGFLLLAGMLTGSRGPFLASILGILLVLIILPSTEAPFRLRWARLAQIGVALTLLIAIFAARLNTLGGVERIVTTLSHLGTGRTETERIEFYRRSTAVIPDVAAIGAGPGTFLAISNGRAKFPHNLELELLLELGIPGLLLGLTLIGLPAGAVLLRMHREPFTANEAALVALWAASILNAQASGDIATNHDVWVTGMIVMLLHRPPGARVAAT